MQPGEVRRLGAREFEMLAVNHAVPAAGYRVACPTGAFAFSGDTTSTDAFWEALNGRPLDLLFVEAAFADRDLELSRLARHYCPSLLAADLSKLRSQPEIYLSHLKAGEEEAILAECARLLPGRSLKRLCDGDVFRL
jgi:ribonuclease BN (tRNA processing enzyme)